MTARLEGLNRFAADHQLPPAFVHLAQTHYFPLLDWLSNHKRSPHLLGINGCQGSGKSTLADFLARFLGEEHGWNVAVLSIDDLYLTRAERQSLAQTVHPLLQTRGVPGTHDVALGMNILDRLCAQQRGESTAIPRFDKSCDDRAPAHTWPAVTGKVDMVILEGWCVGSRPQPAQALKTPVNALEAEEDPEGHWRAFVNRSLQNYQQLFQRLHTMALLKAPDFSCVYHWRLEQERKLASRNPDGKGLMSADEIARFIQHYQRLTEANLSDLPHTADVVLELNHEHGIDRAYYQ